MTVQTFAPTTGPTIHWVAIENDPRVWHNEYHADYAHLPEPFAAAFTALVEASETVCASCDIEHAGWNGDGEWRDATLMQGTGPVRALCADCADWLLRTAQAAA